MLGWIVGVLVYVHLMLLAFENKMARMLYVPPEGLEIDYRVEPRKQAPRPALPPAEAAQA